MIMLTPESEESARSRLTMETIPSPPSGGDNFNDMPARNLHFNSQLHHTPRSRPQHLQLVNKNLQSPHMMQISPHRRLVGGQGVTPRGTAHGQSPATPGNGGSCGVRSDASWTPRGSAFRTPRGALYNPFELEPEAMTGCVFSPGVFSGRHPVQKDHAGSPFWSIDHIAMMKPADIDEMPSQPVGVNRDKEIEERAQRAIDEFFSKNLVGMSPWSEEGKPKRVLCPPSTPSMTDYRTVVPKEEESSSSDRESEEGKKDVGCQTTLTLPVTFDLYKILSQYYTHSTKDDGSTDILSTSSLRRKLFFHGEDDSPPSPVHCGMSRKKSSMAVGEPRTVSRCVTPELTTQSQHHTPSSLFSSSPINSGSAHGAATPSLRRCSTGPELMASPELSPITTAKTPCVTNSSSHRDTKSSSDTTPLCLPLQATPSSGHPSLPFNSPGVSPIRLDLSPLDQCTSASYSRRTRRSKPTPFKLPAPPELSACESPKAFDLDPVIVQKDMETDRSMSFLLGSRSGAGMGDNNGSHIDGFSLSNLTDSEIEDSCEPPDSAHHLAHSTQVIYPEDAGYNTASLQLTNQDTGYNTTGLQLTNQDTGYNTTSLQLTNQDTGYNTNSLQMTNPDAWLNTNLTNQFGNLLPMSGYRDNSVDGDMSDTSQPVIQTNVFATRVDYKDGVRHETVTSGFHENGEYNLYGSCKTTCRANSGSTSPEKLEESLVVRRAKAVLMKDTPATTGDSTSCDNYQVAAPQSGCCSEKSPWQPLSSPDRQQLHKLGLIGDQSADEESLMPSSVALKVLRRAGEDYERFCHQRAPTRDCPVEATESAVGGAGEVS